VFDFFYAYRIKKKTGTHYLKADLTTRIPVIGQNFTHFRIRIGMSVRVEISSLLFQKSLNTTHYSEKESRPK
jgi:hypothetical protein